MKVTLGGTGRYRRRRARGVTASLLAFALVLSACGGTEEVDPDAPAATDDGGDAGSGDAGSDDGGDAGDIRNPGVFVMAVDGEPLSLDPARASLGEYGEQAIEQVYETLIDIGPDSAEPIPGLATEVPTPDNGLVSDDILTYTFPIREGVTFHDGSELTAEVVKYSWDRVMTMDLPEGQASTLSDTIASSRVVDDYTFEVTLQEPNAAFITTVAYSTPAAVVSMEAIEANGGVTAGEPSPFFDTNMVGTNAHRFVSWERNEQLNFEIFEDYWGEPAKLHARWANVPEDSARGLGVQGGDYDAMATNPTHLASLADSDDVCVFSEGYLLEPLQLAFNLAIPEGALPDEDTIPIDFFHDPLVRRAFNYAFDYENFINGVLDGYGQPGGYLPPGLLGYNEDSPKYEQDLEQAEALLREAGWWDEGFSVSVLTEDNPLFEAIALMLKDNIESLNPEFRVNVLSVSEGQFDEAHGTVPFEYAMWVKNADPFGDPHYYMETYFHPDGLWGERMGYRNGYEDPDLIASMIEEAKLEGNPDDRHVLYEELVAELYEDPMWIYPADEVNLQITRCWVEGFVYNPLWKLPRWKFFDKG